MLPQAKAIASSETIIFLPTEQRSAAADTTNAEPTDAQHEQGTATEKDARAEALRRSVLPLLLFSATCYFVSAEGEP